MQELMKWEWHWVVKVAVVSAVVHWVLAHV